MEAKEAKRTVESATKAVSEMGQNQKMACATLQDSMRQANSNQKLWKEGNKSKLIQIGMALIVFPEPTPVSEIVGAGFLAAGVVQKGIKNQSLYMEDIPKDLKKAFKEIYSQRSNLRL